MGDVALQIDARGRLDDLRWIAARTLLAFVCVVPATVFLAALFHGPDLAGPGVVGGVIRSAIEISIVQCVAMSAIISAYDLSLLRRSARAQKDLERLASTDQLTGLLNRSRSTRRWRRRPAPTRNWRGRRRR